MKKEKKSVAFHACSRFASARTDAAHPPAGSLRTSLKITTTSRFKIKRSLFSFSSEIKAKKRSGLFGFFVVFAQQTEKEKRRCDARRMRVLIQSDRRTIRGRAVDRLTNPLDHCAPERRPRRLRAAALWLTRRPLRAAAVRSTFDSRLAHPSRATPRALARARSGAIHCNQRRSLERDRRALLLAGTRSTPSHPQVVCAQAMNSPD